MWLLANTNVLRLFLYDHLNNDVQSMADDE